MQQSRASVKSGRSDPTPHGSFRYQCVPSNKEASFRQYGWIPYNEPKNQKRGYFGANALFVPVAFREANGLTPDGIAGATTRNALNSGSAAAA